MRDRKTPSLKFLAATLIAGLVLPAQAGAQDQVDASSRAAEFGAKALDVVIFRPFGLAATIIGAAFFVPAAIVTSPGGRDTIEEALDLFVLTPGKFVFQRPLGDF